NVEHRELLVIILAFHSHLACRPCSSVWLDTKTILLPPIPKDQHKFRKFPRLRSHFDASATIFHDAITNAQAQPNPFSDILRGEERIENLIENSRINALPIIANREDNLAVVGLAFDRNRRHLVFELLP